MSKEFLFFFLLSTESPDKNISLADVRELRARFGVIIRPVVTRLVNNETSFQIISSEIIYWGSLVTAVLQIKTVHNILQ